MTYANVRFPLSSHTLLLLLKAMRKYNVPLLHEPVPSRWVPVRIFSSEWVVKEAPTAQLARTQLLVDWEERKLVSRNDGRQVWFTPRVPTFTVQGNGQLRLNNTAQQDVFEINQKIRISVNFADGNNVNWNMPVPDGAAH